MGEERDQRQDQGGREEDSMGLGGKGEGNREMS